MCKLCVRFWKAFEKRCDDWEREQSNDEDLLATESKQNWALIQQGSAASDDNPEAAFRFYLAAAEAGSVWATEMVAWHYWTGSGVAADLDVAQQYYRSAIAGGSQMAIIRHAQLLFELDQPYGAEHVLENGVETGFIPAAYWLARYRLNRSNTRGTAEQVRPLLERAAAHGHPDSPMKIARLMAKGKFGLRKIPEGTLRSLREALRQARETRQSSQWDSDYAPG